MSGFHPCRSFLYEAFVWVAPSPEYCGDSVKSLCSKVSELIHSPDFIKNVTIMYPSTQNKLVEEFKDYFLDLQDASYLVSNVSLASLVDVEFVRRCLVPKRISLFNVYDTYSTTIKFHIDASGTLYLVLDLDVFRTLGLSNCRVINRNKEGSLTVEINLLDPSYTKADSKLYERLQKTLAKITPTTVILSSEHTEGIDCAEIAGFLGKNGAVVYPCPTKFQFIEVPLDSKSNFWGGHPGSQRNWLSFLNGKVDSLRDLERDKVSNMKRRKRENGSSLDPSFEALVQDRETLVKIFNTLRKKNSKNSQLIKTMVHELGQKELESDSKYRQEGPVANVFRFIDYVNLKSLTASESSPRGNSQAFSIIKASNGIISKERALDLFKRASELVLPETGLFVMSVYLMSEAKMRSDPLIQVGPRSGSFLHIVCRKHPESGRLTALLIKSD